MGDFTVILPADRRVIEPVCGLAHVLEGVIDRVQDAIDTNFGNNIGKRLRAEVTAGRDVEVLPQIVRHRQLRPGSLRQFGNSMIHSPDADWQSFAEMAENNLEPRIFVEEATSYQAQGVNGCLCPKSPS